jgi:hypothetical protein
MPHKLYLEKNYKNAIFAKEKYSRRRNLNSKNSFLQKNHAFKAKSSRRPPSLCVKLMKLPPL